jgi:hypothetical protein
MTQAYTTQTHDAGATAQTHLTQTHLTQTHMTQAHKTQTHDADATTLGVWR